MEKDTMNFSLQEYIMKLNYFEAVFTYLFWKKKITITHQTKKTKA